MHLLYQQVLHILFGIFLAQELKGKRFVFVWQVSICEFPEDPMFCRVFCHVLQHMLENDVYVMVIAALSNGHVGRHMFCCVVAC